MVKALAVGWWALAILVAGSSPASACGWWGDGENDDNEAIVIGADGRPVPEAEPDNSATPVELKVPPPRSGYGIVVRLDGSAQPYLKIVHQRPAYSIQQLHGAGFWAVIDLGTGPKVAALHRQETLSLGMKYFNIPVDGNVPDKAGVARFGEILTVSGNLPILVFSAKADLLGGMWAYYRLTKGLPEEAAVIEGRGLGLSENGARDIKKRAGR